MVHERGLLWHNSLAPRKQETKPLMRKILSLHLEAEGHPQNHRCRIQTEKPVYTNCVTSLTTLNPNSVQILHYLSTQSLSSLCCQKFLCLKCIKLPALATSQVQILWNLHAHGLKFVSFSPVHLSCVNFMISPTTRTQEGKQGNFPILSNLNKTVFFCYYQNGKKKKAHFLLDEQNL